MYKFFRISIIVRVIIIVALSLLLAFVLVRTDTLFIPVVSAILLIATTLNLIHYFDKSTKDLSQFLLSIRQGAFNESFSAGNLGKNYSQFSEALNEVTREFANLNLEKELHYQYLQAINANIGVAILSFNTDGKLIMMNDTAKKLLQSPFIASIEHFRRIDTNLHDTLTHIAPESRQIVKVHIGEEQLQLSVQAKEIVLQEKHVRIILLQNLNNELEEKEIEAWHQLMRVLTHEIMNSVTPIVSLTNAIHKMLRKEDGSPKDLKKLTSENMDDLFSSLTTISSRSSGLLRFVHTYKEFSKPIEGELAEVDIIGLVQRIVNLFHPDITSYGIKLHTHYPSTSLTVKADSVLIEQVLINILKNAIEAIPHDGTGEIDIIVMKKTSDVVSISISDNGVGIDNETMSRIFVPFFTTKPNGSGIGLSLCRQIMKMHNGSIRINSAVGEGSKVVIEW